jgi:hypothetical protein
MRSVTDSYGESAGATMTSGSSVSSAIGVTSANVASDWLVSIAPTMTRPITMRVFSSRSLASWARPMVPPAPGTLTTWASPTRSLSCRTPCISRAVESQPPPGSAGTMIFTSSIALSSAEALSALSPIEPQPARAIAPVSARAVAARWRRWFCKRVMAASLLGIVTGVTVR